MLFDFDGVLAHYDHGALLQSLGERTQCTIDAVAAAMFESGLEPAANLGEFDAQGQADEFSRRLGSPASLADCVNARRVATTPDADVLDLVSRVLGRAEIAILTNNGLMLREHFSEICPPLVPMFAGRLFCSAQFRVGKPDPAIFQRCLSLLGVAPEQTLFVDDKELNVAAARQTGLLGHRYLNAANLESELQRLQLLEPPSHAN